MVRNMQSYRKYIWAFVITAAIFLAVTLVSNYFDNRRIDEIKSIQDSISMNILSSETQFDLLKETPCEDLNNSSLSQELETLGEQVSYLESTRGSDDSQVIQLKQEYALLEIKDYILLQNMSQKCGNKPVFVLYFYSNNGDCPDCADAGAVLTELRQEFPQVRIYSFDYHSAVSTQVQTLENIYNVKEQFPALVIHNKPVYGLKSLSDIEALMPELEMSTSTATSTKAK